MDRSAPGSCGDRTVPADGRYYFGYLALTPAALSLGLGLRHSFLCQGHPALTWILLGAAGLASYVGSIFWVRRVPSVVSLYLGIIFWAATFCFFWRGQV